LSSSASSVNRATTAKTSGTTAIPLDLNNAPAARMHPLAGALPNVRILGFDPVTAQDAWVVGASGCTTNGGNWQGFIQATSNAGQTWTLQETLANNVITHVSFVNPQDGWALEQQSACGSKTVRYLIGTRSSTVLLTTDGGRTWTTGATIPGVVGTMHFTSPSDGWATLPGGLLATTDGGRQWSSLPGSPSGVLALSSQGQLDWAVAQTSTSPEIYGSTDGGGRWQRLATFDSHGNGVTSAVLRFTSPQDGWVAFADPFNCTSQGCGVQGVYRTTDGGATWTQVAGSPGCPPGAALGAGVPAADPTPVVGAAGTSVAIVSAVNGAVCGPGPLSTLSLSTNGGTSFRTVHSLVLRP
jgi:photosystem II stability/assembly factor-like uncharacterized protein